MFCFLSSTYSSQKNRWFFGNNTGTSIVSLIVDYYGSYSCIVNRRDGRLSAGKDRVTEKLSLSGWWHRWRRYHRDHCAVIVHIKGMASSELFENILSGDSLVVRIIPALLAGVVMSRIITRLPGLDISCPETDSLS